MTIEQMAKRDGATVIKLSETQQMMRVIAAAKIKAHGYYQCTMGDKRVIVVAD